MKSYYGFLVGLLVWRYGIKCPRFELICKEYDVNIS